MTLTAKNTLAAVVGVALVASAVFAIATPRAHALTLSEMIEMFIVMEIIPADKVDQARTLITSDDTAPAAMSCNFTRDLTTGSTGADVMDLQKLLNANGFTVATAGAGSPGMETTYYGPATARAVSAMQEAFASEILAPVGLTMGTGYFGGNTRAKANTLCATVVTPTTPTTPTTPETPSTPSMSNSEASLERFNNTNEYSGEEISEGDEVREVYEFEFDVENGDVEISRVDIRFEEEGGYRPYRAFDEVTLMYNGEEVGSLATDSRNDWSDEAGDAYELRFNDVDVMVEEGEIATFTVAVSVMNIDDTDLNGMKWYVWVPNDGVRGRDGAGLDQYIGDANARTAAADEEHFTIKALGADTEVRISDASSNPEQGTILVDNNSKTNDVTIGVFEYKSDEGDTTINELRFALTVTGASPADAVSDLAIEIDGDRFNDWYLTGAEDGTTQVELNNADTDGNTYYVVFNLQDNDDEYTVDANDTVTVEFLVDFNKVTITADDFSTGDTIEVDASGVTVDNWDVEDEDYNDITSTITGSWNGEKHTMIGKGVYAELDSTNTSYTTNNDGDKVKGTYTVRYVLKSYDQISYVNKTAAAGTELGSSTTAGAVYAVIASDGTATTTGTSISADLSCTGCDTDGDRWVIPDDNSGEKITLTVSYNAAVADFYMVRLLGVNYYSEASGGTPTAYATVPATDYETGTIDLD
jgi:hypothetical protein